MTGWIVLGVILVLLLLLVLCRVGVEIVFAESKRVTAFFGPIRLQIVPKPQKKEKKPKKESKKDTKKKEAKPAKEKVSKPKISASAILACLPQAWQILKKGLRMTRKRLRIDPLELSLTIGGEDPADTAILYGKAEAAMWTFMPQLQRLVHMPSPHIHLEPELQGGKTKADGQVGLSFLIWDLLVIGFACGIPMLKLLWKLRKQVKDTNNLSGKDEEHGKQQDDSQRNDGDIHEQGSGDGQQ